MSDPPAASTVRDLRDRLRADLTRAMKDRRPEAVSALRTTMAAIDNAEAVAPPDAPAPATSAHIAGAHAGAGAADAPRRELSPDDVNALIRRQITERIAEAERYDGLGRREEAGRLRREADALRVHVTG